MQEKQIYIKRNASYASTKNFKINATSRSLNKDLNILRIKKIEVKTTSIKSGQIPNGPILKDFIAYRIDEKIEFI